MAEDQRSATDDASTYSDDVFEDQAETEKRIEQKRQAELAQYYNYPSALKSRLHYEEEHRAPSPSGYPGYKPPREALQLYGMDPDVEYERRNRDYYDEYEDGWRSYQYDDDENECSRLFDPTISHKVGCSFILFDFWIRC